MLQYSQEKQSFKYCNELLFLNTEYDKYLI